MNGATLQSEGEVFPFDQLENQERLVIRFVEAVDRGDVRVIERREHLRFPFEPGEPLRVPCYVRGKDFDRDVTPELLVARAIHLADPALAEFGDDLVGAEAVSRGQWQEVGPYLMKLIRDSTRGTWGLRCPSGCPEHRRSRHSSESSGNKTAAIRLIRGSTGDGASSHLGGSFAGKREGLSTGSILQTTRMRLRAMA